jgi:hypothetical protein
MLWVRNAHEITGEVQEHPLAGGRPNAPAALHSLVEIAGIDSQNSGNFIQPASGHTIDPLLVLTGAPAGR